MTVEISRRGFITLAAGTGVGLVIGMRLPTDNVANAADVFAPNPFVRIAPDDSVTVVIKHLDKGQGIATGLSTLVAEELDADWEQIRAEFAPADTKRYKNLFWGRQGTGMSTSIANSYEQYRTAGAIARQMLVAAAAASWKVEAIEVSIAAGRLSHASGRVGTFGEFAEAASLLTMSSSVSLKQPSAFTFIGKSFKRIDTDAKSTGQPIFTQDIHFDGMIVAAVAHPPRFGARVKSFDAAEALKTKGVLGVKEIPQGVAVYATDTWRAFVGRDMLQIEWDEADSEKRGTAELLAEYRKLATTAGLEARVEGDAELALSNAAHIVEADFEFPYLAHATMEPMNAVVRFDGETVRIWTASQSQTNDQRVAAVIFGVKPGKVLIDTKYAGGSFGRRAVPNSDFVAEASEAAKAWGQPNPVKLVWSREDDMRAGHYRPMYLHRVRAGLDDDGRLIAWHHRIVGQSILAGTSRAPDDGIDPMSVEGILDSPYALFNIKLELHTVDVGVPVLWWRAVGHTHTAYAVETMMDRLAAKAGKDPVEFRFALLKDKPRHRAVLALAAEKAGWTVTPPAGRFRGIALHESFSTYVAQVAEISVNAEGGVKVERVVCAVDCGLAVNPDIVRAQMEGGIGFGLGAAIRGKITLTEGVVDQSNFDGYEPLRIGDMPAVEVHIVDSREHPTGVGEPGVPPIAPAVANAVFKATGKEIAVLPFELS